MSSEQSRVSATFFRFCFMSLFLLLLISLVSKIFSYCSMPSFLLNDFTRNVVKEREENIKCADSIQFEKKLLEAFFTFF